MLIDNEQIRKADMKFYSLNRRNDVCVEKADMPSYFRLTNISESIYCNTFVLFGKNKRKYCIEESHVENRICRILNPDCSTNKVTTIRDDGTVWTVFLDSFDGWSLIRVA